MTDTYSTYTNMTMTDTYSTYTIHFIARNANLIGPSIERPFIVTEDV